MILILLFATACIISFIDLSDRYLDAETTSMLYCDEVSSDNTEKDSAVKDAEGDDNTTESFTVTTDDTVNETEEILSQKQTTTQEDVDSAFAGALDSLKGTDNQVLRELDNLDDEEDEVPQSSSYLNKEEIDASVQAILESYNGGAS